MDEYKTAWYWILLSTLVPYLGPLIFWLAKKDSNPKMAEIGKWLLVAEILLLVPFIGIFLWFGVMLWRFVAEKDSEYRGWYLFFAIPVIGFIAALLIDIPSEAKKDMAILFGIYVVLAIIAALALYSTIMTLIAGASVASKAGAAIH
ncbi:MAG: hypothetical protein GXN93_05680 [Candidatus Diapherotrites archaeon]|nr:hypothetical protein [Candidatus Diapherotrites archaeon]